MGLLICGVGANWVYMNQESSTIIAYKNNNLFLLGEHVLIVHASFPVTLSNFTNTSFPHNVCTHIVKI